MLEPRISVRGITKLFPGVKALDEVSFEVLPGSVHALCGENGAGKSTLMKCINGLYQPDIGSIYVNGKPKRVRNPIEAQALGIAMIAQEINYVPDMSIAENFFIGNLPRKFGRIDWGYIRKEATRIIAEEGLDYSVTRKIRTLTVSEIQMLEIIKACYHSADILIMDEPTSAIAHKEVESLFRKIRRLRDEGKSIIYISHKMDEVFEIADWISVLRDGTVVSSQPATQITASEVIAQMVGRNLDHQAYPKEHIELGTEVIKVENLSCDKQFEDISITVKAGEIVGLAGLIGAGRSEVVQSIFGLQPINSGKIYVAGKECKINSPKQAIANGVAMLSEDRRLQGIIPKLSIKKNATLASLNKIIYNGFTHKKVEQELVSAYFERMQVKAPNQDTIIENLSGGNQQKVLLARWLIANPKIMLLDEPTRGIDVGAKFEIYSLMTQLAKQGRGILMISSELPELIGMCDRIYVMAGGRITAELAKTEFSQERILTYAMDEAGGQ